MSCATASRIRPAPIRDRLGNIDPGLIDRARMGHPARAPGPT